MHELWSLAFGPKYVGREKREMSQVSGSNQGPSAVGYGLTDIDNRQAVFNAQGCGLATA